MNHTKSHRAYLRISSVASSLMIMLFFFNVSSVPSLNIMHATSNVSPDMPHSAKES